MSERYCLQDVCNMLALSYRDVRKLLANVSIMPTQSAEDKRRWEISAEEYAILASLAQAERIPAPKPKAAKVAPAAIVLGNDPRIDALLQRLDRQDAAISAQESTIHAQEGTINELQRRLAALEARQWARPAQTTDYTATSLPGHATASTARRISPPQGDRSAGDTLPDGWMSLNEFSRTYGTAVTTLEKARLRGKFAYHVAPDEDHLWKRGQAKILYALDREQQAALLTLYPPKPGYEEGPASPAGPELLRQVTINDEE